MTRTDAPARSYGHLAALDRFYAAETRFVAAGGAPAGADFSEMATHFHPEVVIHQGPSVPYPGEWVGVDGVERFFATFSQLWAELDLSDIAYFEGRTGVAISMRMRAIARNTGRQLDTQVGHFITFDDGLIRDFVVMYLDPLRVRDVVAA